jgi:hypothetical protein
VSFSELRKAQTELTIRAFVVRGAYPSNLVDEFDEYQALHGSASISPGLSTDPHLVYYLTIRGVLLGAALRSDSPIERWT